MTLSQSFAKEIEKKLLTKGADLSCLVCGSPSYSTIVITRSIPDVLEEGEVHDDMILEVSCTECGAMRFFNLNYFGDGGVYAESITQEA